MKFFWSFIMFVLSLPLFSTSNTSKVDFFRGPLNVAQEKAAAEGKLYFVEFMASWCQPCRWMDETTFRDPRLIEYIKGSYIPVKVDIDDFDGFAYKQKYNIRLLPSILVFNSKGELLAKYEESFAPSKLLGLLKGHDLPMNRVRLAPKPKPKTSTSTPSTTKPTTSYKPPVLTPSTSTTTPQSSADASDDIVKINAEGEGLYRFKVWKQESRGYSLQIGAFGQLANVLREVAKLQRRYDEPIIVHVAKINNSRTVFKILVGEFMTQQEAFQFQKETARKGLSGIIKDLSLMK